MVATAALEAGLTRPDEMIDCQMGSITIGRHVFHDHKRYGLLSFSQILEYSSNVGAAKLGLRLGEQRLYEALRTFGFGSKTGIELPGEIVGLVRDWHDWSGLSIGAISFGQEVGVTSIQILTAINAIANGGYGVRPSLVDRIIDEKGDLVSVNAPERVRLMSPRTAEAVSNAFEGVVLRGTGRRAALEGYRAAGKTGTAQKIVDGHYSSSKYVSSFIGFAPLPHPRFTILVQIDEPKGMHYGGDVSAPFFQKIAQEALLQLRVPPRPQSSFASIQASACRQEYRRLHSRCGSASEIVQEFSKRGTGTDRRPLQSRSEGGHPLRFPISVDWGKGQSWTAALLSESACRQAAPEWRSSSRQCQELNCRWEQLAASLSRKGT